MKSILFIITLTWVTISLNAQMRYNPGDTVKGKNVSYYCEDYLPNRAVKVRNIKNIDTLATAYTDNGEIVAINTYTSDSEKAFHREAFIQAFKKILTSQEIGQIKSKGGYLGIEFTVDKLGNVKEITFIIRYSDPVLSRITPDRLYQLEISLKQLIKVKLGQNDRKINNLKYWESIDYRYDL